MGWFLYMLVSAIIVFFILLFSTCLPYTFLRNHCIFSSKFAISLLGCASCGIFIATCFLGLVPHVRHQEMHLSSNSTILKESIFFPTTDQLIVIGFLIILISEQIIHVVGHSIDSGTNNYTQANQSNIKMRKILDTNSDDAEPLVEVDPSIDDEQDDIIFRRTSSPHMNECHNHSIIAHSMSIRVWFLLLGMSIHSFFEGIALGVQNDEKSFYQLAFAVMLHEVLCCVSFGIQLAKHNASRVYAWSSSIFLSATIPIGMLLATTIDGIGSDSWQKLGRYWLEGLAAGTFVHVALVELLPMELHSDDGGHGHSHNIIGDANHPVELDNQATPKSSKWDSLIKSVFVVIGVVVFVVIKAIIGDHH